jgi:8-oxo-dGTP pyrophosphatase MutT (NUDIX family)
MSKEEKKLLTLCVVYDNTRILLGMKKRGFGMGRWNGFGGKVEPGESAEQAAQRELREEAGLQPQEFLKRGILQFHYPWDEKIWHIHIFSTTKFFGEARESDEMLPRWFLHTEIPYTAMWADDPYWLPKILAGKNIEGVFHFKDKNTILSHSILEL